MANAYSELIIALDNAYIQTINSLTALRQGSYDTGTLDTAKQAIVLYKTYANKRLALENTTGRSKNILETILNDLGEPPIYIERNIIILRTYIYAYDPTYVEPV